MTTTLEPTDMDVDVSLDDAPPVDPWDHAEPITPPEPTPEPADDGLTSGVRAMVAELDQEFGGKDPGSVGKAIKAMRPDPTQPSPWASQGQAGKAVKAYRDKHGIQTEQAAPKKAARTKPQTPRRTAVVRPEPTAPVPPVVRPEPVAVVREPVPSPPPVVQPDPVPQPQTVVRRAAVWPVTLLAAPAFVAIWSGWVGLGGLTGFGVVHPLPGIWDSLQLNTAITLPIGVETYGAYALYVWLSGRVPARARRFAKWSAIASLVVGAAGQVAYHLLVAAGVTSAPWQITTAVACLPVAVLGMGAALAHLVREEN